MKTCKFNQCVKKHFGFGYCRNHYNEYKKFGVVNGRTLSDGNKFIINKNYVAIEIYNIKREVVCLAMIDLEDYDKCKNIHWSRSNDGYIRNTQVGYLHNYVLNRDSRLDNLVCDHIDRNKNNCKKNNLRVVDYFVSNSNTSMQNNNKVGIKNICQLKNNKFRFQKQYRGKRISRDFVTIEKAIEFGKGVC